MKEGIPAQPKRPSGLEGERRLCIDTFTEAERQNFNARVLSQIAFPDLQSMDHPVYEGLSVEEITTLRNASQPQADVDATKRSLTLLNDKYDTWLDENP